MNINSYVTENIFYLHYKEIILFRKIATVYFNNSTNRVNTMLGFYVSRGGTYRMQGIKD
jgi:hypothetical protein